MSESERREPYIEDLCRTAEFTLVRAEQDGDDGLTIEGYGAVFNSVTEINSWEGAFEEVIAPGAFKKSLRERTPKMQFDHGRHPLLGSLPLGRWTTAEEDTRGLHLVGRLTDNWLVEPFRDAIADGGVEGMSFRFTVEREEWTDKNGKKLKEEELWELLWRGAGDRGPIRRTLKEVRASEAGPVVWPAYSDTEVGVRSGDTSEVIVDLGRLRAGNPTELSRLAKLVAVADTRDDAHTDADAPEQGTSEAVPEQDDTEPRSTDRSADEHPAPEAAPPVTDPSAGEHSSPAIPVNPADRRALIADQMRVFAERRRAASQSTLNERRGA